MRTRATRVSGVAITFLLIACSESTIEIRARSSTTSQEGIGGIHLWLNGSEFDATDFRPDASGLLEISTSVPNSGQLQIDMELRQEGEVVAAGTFSLDMQDNFEWGMDLFRQSADPLLGCIGCFGAEDFPLSPSAQNEPGEAIWFAWGGKPRGSDIVY